MKKLLLISFLFFYFLNSKSQSVGIGTNIPDPSAKLDVNSITQGLLPPRMTYAQRCLIPYPAAGLIIWCIDCNTQGQLQVFNGVDWSSLMAGSANIAPTVSLCSKVWMTRNLDVVTYRNGDTIPQVTDQTQWGSLCLGSCNSGLGAWCWYNNDSATYAATYGKLYNWYAVNDPRGLAPIGWHIPTYYEWNELVICADPLADTSIYAISPQSLIAGGLLKEKDTSHWNNPNTGATNATGFTGLPGGMRTNTEFSYIGIMGWWWTSTRLSSLNSWNRILYHNQSYMVGNGFQKTYGFSVRCIKD